MSMRTPVRWLVARRIGFGLIVAPAFLLLLAGCATVSRDAGFDDVRNSVAQRGGQTIQWRGRSAEDEEVDAAVNAMLQRELSVSQAVQIALLNNRGLQATYEELGIAQADVVEAGLLRNPVFDASLRFPDGGGRPDIELGVAQNFIDLLQLPMRKKVAAARFEETKLHVAHEVQGLATRTAAAFYALQGAQQMLELHRSVVAATEASADLAMRLHAAGNLTDLDYANQRSMYEQARIDLSSAESKVEEHRERLNVLMGVGEASVRWTVAVRLPELPAAELQPDGLEELAVRQRLDLAAAEQAVVVEARVLGIAQSFAGVHDVEAGVSTEREVDGQWITGPSLSVPIPIFDQGQGATARARSRHRQAQQKYEAMRVEVRSEVRAARTRLFSARRQAEQYRTVLLPLRHKVVEQTQLQYNAMLVGAFELLAAKREEIGAGRQYVEALRDYWTARVELEQAVGGRLPAGEPQPASRPVAPATVPVEAPAPSEHQHHDHGDQP